MRARERSWWSVAADGLIVGGFFGALGCTFLGVATTFVFWIAGLVLLGAWCGRLIDLTPR